MENNQKNIRLTASILKDQISAYLKSRDSNGVIGFEVMYGSSRRVADMVFISQGHSYAIEIKSEFDTTSRLEGQLQEYQTLFDYVIVFSAPNHISTISPILSDNVGLYRIDNNGIKKITCERINHGVLKSEMLISIPSAVIKNDFSIRGKLTSDEIRAIVGKKSYKTIHDYFIKYYITKLSNNESHFIKEYPNQEDILIDYIIIP